MLLKQSENGESGQGSSEYALLMAAIVVLVVLATTLFEEQVTALFNSIGNYLQGQI